MSIYAQYFDGINASPQTVYVEQINHLLILKTTQGQIVKQLSQNEYKVQPAIGKTQRIIELPMGAHLRLTQESLSTLIPTAHPSNFWSILHHVENHLGLVSLTLVGAILASLAFMRWGVPLLAYTTASFTPPAIEVQLGQQTLDALDEPKLGYFMTSALSASEQANVTQQLVQLCSQTKSCPTYTLHFRKSHPSIGANAFALPGGQLVLTDALFKLAKNSNEVTAVLAHELGHIKKRHALRQILQSSLSGLLIVMLTGDFSSIAASIPTAMLHLQYTRDLEKEADDYALASMLKACLPTRSFADILLRLDQQSHQGASIPEFLSSHPATQKRIQPFIDSNVTCL